MVVGRDDLERSIAALRAEVADPRAGIYGPDSVSWLVDRELVTFVAGGRAALLQLAHPAVAHAVDQHSATRHDLAGRFQRTFRHVFAMAFGDLDHAVAAARRVHAIHSRIHGTDDRGAPYHANDPEALLWVHATLVDSAVLAFEQVIRPLSPVERDRYLYESRRFARLFGIPLSDFPADWPAFDAYNRRMWATLRITEPAREMARFLMRAPRPALQPLADHYALLTAGLLPARVRDGFGFPWSPRRRWAFAATLRALRAIYPQLPARLRQVPAYTHAVRRLRGRPGPDPVAARLERLLFEPFREC